MTRPLAVFVAFLFIATACASATSRPSPIQPLLASGGAVEAKPGPPATAGAVLVPPGGADLFVAPGDTTLLRAHEGLVFGFSDRDGEWLEVMTTCDEVAWVHQDSVEVTRRSERVEVGPEFDLAAATVVLDPGHGARDWGGVGPAGLREKAVNLDIAERVSRLLRTSHDVDWATGAISRGTSVPAVSSVWLTRRQAGPAEGDYELGLAFRAHLANAAGADALISIHNNTVPRVATDAPGTEVFYSVGTEDSDRLAGLIHEELMRSFAEYSAPWQGGELLGAKGRIDPETGDDYYGLLRRAEMPAVIVEGLYISEPEEEALLATVTFRQSYAEGVYRGIVRFLTTSDAATAINPPEPFPDDAGTVSTSRCEVPAQP